MFDSTADTNIPVTRLPFGAELPPKVPYSTTDSVGVGDAASENLPVQVNNRQIVAVGTSSNPIRAVHLKRKSSGKTVNDVPTSDTPNADDPDTMIATKQYVDSNAPIVWNETTNVLSLSPSISGTTYTWTVPTSVIRPSLLTIDFFTVNRTNTGTLMELKVGNNVIAQSAEFPTNCSGFQMSITVKGGVTVSITNVTGTVRTPICKVFNRV